MKKSLYEVIFFDFDGVLVESVEIKTQSFEKMYERFGTAVSNGVKEYGRKAGGLSRYEKFVYCHSKFLDQSLSEDELETLSDEYSSLVLEEVKNCEAVSGSIEFLQRAKKDFR